MPFRRRRPDTVTAVATTRLVVAESRPAPMWRAPGRPASNACASWDFCVRPSRHRSRFWTLGCGSLRLPAPAVVVACRAMSSPSGLPN